MDLYAQDKSPVSTKELTSYKIKQRGNSKVLFDFEKDCTFKHGEKITNLIKARILEQFEKDGTIAPDLAKYICFEIPEKVTIEDLAENKIFDILNQMGKFENLMPKNYNNVGFIDKDSDDKFELYKPTSEVLSYTRDILDNEIEENGKLLGERIRNKQFKESISIPATEYIQENKSKREKRIKEPFLEEQLRYRINKTVYTNYRGVDVLDGKLLDLNKVGIAHQTMDDILYTGFVHKLENENKIELKTLQAIPSGSPVLFTTKTRVDDMIQNNDNKGIGGLLELVSGLENTKEIKYIGSLDKDGRIDRSGENCTEEIKQKMDEEKQKYKIELEKQEELEKEKEEAERA